VYSVAVAAPRSRRLLSLVVATMLVAGLITPRGLRFTDVIFGPAFVVVAWLIGENVRTRRAFAAEREREREERILRAAADERLRIARELHDVVAHSMSIIAVQSGVGRVVMDSQPDEARKALAAIESTSRQALQEMRRLLGVLRQPESMDLSSPLGPAPGLDRVDELVSQASQAGVAVSVQVSGSPRELPPGVDLSAYRIIQEALTNIVRHVGPSNASVAIRYSPDDVSVEVLDDGGSRGADASSSSDGTGHGLVGMRERVGLFGGSLEVGPRRGGGFRVFACLPAAAS
jgi:signal transduction histidine kinase